MDNNNQKKKLVPPKGRATKGTHDKDKNAEKHSSKKNLKNYLNSNKVDTSDDFEEYE